MTPERPPTTDKWRAGSIPPAASPSLGISALHTASKSFPTEWQMPIVETGLRMPPFPAAFPSLPSFPASLQVISSNCLLNKQPALPSLPQGLFLGELKSMKAILYLLQLQILKRSTWLVLVWKKAKKSPFFLFHQSTRFHFLHFPKICMCLKEIHMSHLPLIVKYSKVAPCTLEIAAK